MWKHLYTRAKGKGNIWDVLESSRSPLYMACKFAFVAKVFYDYNEPFGSKELLRCL